MEDRRREDRIGATVADRGDEIRRAGRTARGDDRDLDACGDRPEERGVES